MLVRRAWVRLNGVCQIRLIMRTQLSLFIDDMITQTMPAVNDGDPFEFVKQKNSCKNKTLVKCQKAIERIVYPVTATYKNKNSNNSMLWF